MYAGGPRGGRVCGADLAPSKRTYCRDWRGDYAIAAGREHNTQTWHRPVRWQLTRGVSPATAHARDSPHPGRAVLVRSPILSTLSISLARGGREGGCEKRQWGTAGRSGEEGAAVRLRGLAAEEANRAQFNRGIPPRRSRGNHHPTCCSSCCPSASVLPTAGHAQRGVVA